MDEAIATAMHVLHSSPNTSLGNYSPGSLVFCQDMFLDIPIIADLLTLTCHCQALIHHCLLQANSHHICHEYKVGDKVFVHVHNCPNKLSLNPFPILQVHTNNTVTIQGGPVDEEFLFSISFLSVHDMPWWRRGEHSQ